MPKNLPTNELGVSLFAARRPDWTLPDVDAIHSDLHLHGVDENTQELAGKRVACPSCKRNRALYCYDCRIALVDAPCLQLPCKFSIITHQAEYASKNTGIQSYILAPGHVELHDIEHFPEFDPARAVVLFPSDDALTVDQLEPGSVDRAIIIDSKWRKARELVAEPVLKGVRRVRLTATKSAFWRFHTAEVSEEGVCTVEAMLHFLRAMVLHDKFAPHQLPPAPPAQQPPTKTAIQEDHVEGDAALQPSGTAGEATGPGAPTSQGLSVGDPANATSEDPARDTATLEPQGPSLGESGGGASVPSCQQGASHISCGPDSADGSNACKGDLSADPGTDRNTNTSATETNGDCTAAGAATSHSSGWNGDDNAGGQPAPLPAAYHAFDDLMWFFVIQHKHIQNVAARRLEERKERHEKGYIPAKATKKLKAAGQYGGEDGLSAGATQSLDS